MKGTEKQIELATSLRNQLISSEQNMMNTLALKMEGNEKRISAYNERKLVVDALNFCDDAATIINEIKGFNGGTLSRAQLVINLTK